MTIDRPFAPGGGGGANECVGTTISIIPSSFFYGPH